VLNILSSLHVYENVTCLFLASIFFIHSEIIIVLSTDRFRGNL
jgi:hypothetical protein